MWSVVRMYHHFKESSVVVMIANLSPPQIAFYIHCAYATVFLETIRQDFVVLMLHHGLTISLLMYSFCVRYVRSVCKTR